MFITREHEKKLSSFLIEIFRLKMYDLWKDPSFEDRADIGAANKGTTY